MTPPEYEYHPKTGIAPGFLRRLSVYLFGIAIGLVLLGLFHQARSGAMQRRQAAAESGAAPQPGADDQLSGTPDDARDEATPRPSDEQDG